MASLDSFTALIRQMNEATLQIFFFAGLILIALGMIATVVLAFRQSRAWGLFSLTGVGGAVFLVRRPKPAMFAWALLVLGLLIAGAPMLMTHLVPPSRAPIVTKVGEQTHVTLTNADRTKEEVQKQLDQSNVTVLQMVDNTVTDDNVQQLKGHATLEELDLSNSSITDACLPILAGLPELQVLRLKNTAITDEGFRTHLMPLARLRRLDVTGVKLKPETIAEWKAARVGRRALQ